MVRTEDEAMAEPGDVGNAFGVAVVVEVVEPEELLDAPYACDTISVVRLAASSDAAQMRQTLRPPVDFPMPHPQCRHALAAAPHLLALYQPDHYLRIVITECYFRSQAIVWGIVDGGEWTTPGTRSADDRA